MTTTAHSQAERLRRWIVFVFAGCGLMAGLTFVILHSHGARAAAIPFLLGAYFLLAISASLVGVSFDG